MSTQESDIAWMTVRDAALLQALLLHVARARDRPLSILEWGSGRSTLELTAILEAGGFGYEWITLEHHREFFLADMAPAFAARRDARWERSEDAKRFAEHLRPGHVPGLHGLVFDAGLLRPYEDQDLPSREADLDDYVAVPASLGRRFDLVLVDGRKRRRCLLEAARLLQPDGVAVLHDGWRPHYQCAFAAYRHHRRVGDELWVGAQREVGLDRVLPAHAFDRHADECGNPAV